MSKRSTPGQQTLFEYIKRKKQSESSDDDDGVSPSAPQRQAQQTQQQGNFVTVQNPSGGTTIVINADAFAGTSTACTSTRVPTHSLITADVPSTSQPTDIASGPHETPVQPSHKFPSTLLGTKKRSFNPDWFKTYSTSLQS